MPQDRKSQAVDPEELGRSFEAQSSPSFGGDLGRSFEEHNSSREEYEKLKNRGRRRMFMVGGLLLVLLVVAVIYFTTRPKKGAAGKTTAAAPAAGAAGGKRGQQGPATITEDHSTTGNINVYVNALGTVTPLNTITIYSQITGKVIAVHYREGQIVSKGDPLVDIDPEPYKATLAQAEGTLQHDQGVLAEARIDLNRYQDAYAANAIARQQLEDQQQAVVQDEGTVKTDEATVDYDKIQLSYCHIVAPISGRVGLRLVDPGNTVFAGTGSTLVVLTQLQPITVVFNVSEDDLPQVQAQLKSGHVLSVDAFDRSDSKQITTGKLTSLDNQIDTTTGTLKFRATFANPGSILFPNQFVNARLLVKTLQNVVLVPSAAVQQNGTAAFVYLVKPDPKDEKSATVAVQNISVLTSNEKVNAVQGLPSGATVATSGFDRLEAGAHVQVQKQSPGVKPQPASNAPPTTGNATP
jgi:multidrug efflux system membrane fusion protein